MKIYFSLISIALLVATLANGAMLWDGSYYLYWIVDKGMAFTPHNRWVNFLIHTPVLIAATFTQKIETLQLVFGVTYGFIPLLSLALSWWIVRLTAPKLFIWAAIGASFVTIFLQLHFVSEAIIAIQLTWPMFLAQFVPGRKQAHIVVGILTVALLFCHPFSVALFAMTALGAFIVGWRSPKLRREKWSWALVLVIFSIIALSRLVFLRSSYETERISLDVLRKSYGSIAGLPVRALLSAFIMSGLIFFSEYVGYFKKYWLTIAVSLTQIITLTVAAALLVSWASQHQFWSSSFSYRVLALIISLPVFGWAGLEGLLYLSRSAISQHKEATTQRLRLIQLIGVAFALILITQSWSWKTIQNRLVDVIGESPSACIDLDDVAVKFDGSKVPFRHWTITIQSLLLQGRTPKKLIRQAPCSQVDFTQGLPIAPWDVRAWENQRLFDMHQLEENLRHFPTH